MISLPASTDSPTPTDPTAAIELAYRIGGTVIGIGLAVASAFWEVILSPMRATLGHTSYRIPLALVLAIVGNIGIVWFTHKVTGRIGLAVVPAVGWLAVVLLAARKTAEGDLLVTGDNWVGLLLLFLGCVAWAVAAYRLILKAPRPAPSPAPARPPPAKRAGRAVK